MALSGSVWNEIDDVLRDFDGNTRFDIKWSSYVVEKYVGVEGEVGLVVGSSYLGVHEGRLDNRRLGARLMGRSRHGGASTSSLAPLRFRYESEKLGVRCYDMTRREMGGERPGELY